ncbi:TPA: hypothetical protein ACG1TJ_002272 [Salmonella enterica]
MKTDTDGLTMNQLAERNAEHVATISALESRCAALSAENAAMKSAKEIIRHLNANREEANFCGIDDCHIDDAVEAMLTPATYAFLAEVRASAIEAFADNQEKIADEELVGGNLDLSLRFRGMARAAKEFAAQIRQEATQ